MKNCFPARTLLLASFLLFLSGCGRPGAATYQGYVEGEFVHLAAPLAGRLDKLAVAKGTRVAPGTPLFSLEQGAESAALSEAAGRLRAAQARATDLRKGLRPPEIAALESRLAQARTAAVLATREYERIARLHESRVSSEDDFDRAMLNRDTADHLVAELTAQLETARLGTRTDLIVAAEAEAASAQAALDRAGWALAQKSVSAPRGGLIYDTLYREGEFVAAALPVVVLLPPENIKVRFFVPEADFGALKAGDRVQVTRSGQAAALEARITYLSPQPEYTPPVLYNRENRSKLVFMVEATFAVAVGDLHPGQPVDVAPVP